MNVCIICEADGVLEALGHWYCKEHLEEGIIDVVMFVAPIRGWNIIETEDEIQEWLDS